MKPTLLDQTSFSVGRRCRSILYLIPRLLEEGGLYVTCILLTSIPPHCFKPIASTVSTHCLEVTLEDIRLGAGQQSPFQKERFTPSVHGSVILLIINTAITFPYCRTWQSAVLHTWKSVSSLSTLSSCLFLAAAENTACA